MSKTILITGVTSGFGKAIMEKFLTEGHRVIGVARRKERLHEMQEIYGEKVWMMELDVAKTDKIENFFAELPAEWSHIDILVNNAGLALGMEPAFTADLRNWDTMIDVNIRGLTHMTYHYLQLMQPKNVGHIINIGSTAGNMPYKGGNIYGSTKAFVRHFSKNLRTELLGTRIHVTNIEPGKSETEFSLVRFAGDEEKAKKVYEGYDFICPEDIAEAVYFAASQPHRVNIDTIEVLGIDEAQGGMQNK